MTTSKAVIQAGWDDAPWLPDDKKAQMLADTPPHLKDARSKGLPAMGSGNVYPISLEEVLVDPFPIPPHWKQMFALDVGWNKTAALWCAYDEDQDTIYLIKEYYVGEQLPAVHAAAIRAHGPWIPGVIDPASTQSSQFDGAKLFMAYMEQGLVLRKAQNEVYSGITNTYNRLGTGKLKVFRTLQNFMKEYMLYRYDDKGRVVKERDHLMDCMRYIVNNIRYAMSQEALTNGGGAYNGTISYDI